MTKDTNTLLLVLALGCSIAGGIMAAIAKAWPTVLVAVAVTFVALVALF